MGLRRQDGALTHPFSFLSTCLFTLTLWSCGQPSPRLLQPPSELQINPEASCGSLMIQEEKWSHKNTVALSRCVLGDHFQIEQLSAEELNGLTQYLQNSFASEEGRAQLSHLLSTIKKHYPLLKKWVQLPELRSFLSTSQLDSSIPWFHQNLQLFLSPDSATPLKRSEYRALYRGLQSLSKAEESLPFILALVETLEHIAPQAHDSEDLRDQKQLEAAYRILKTTTLEPEIFQALLALSEEHACTRNEIGLAPSSTQAPLWTALEYFQRDHQDPRFFLSSIKQGFEFWNQVCQSKTGLQPEALDPSLTWVFTHWNDLQLLLSSNSPSFSKLAVKLLRKNDALEQSSLRLLFAHPTGQRAVIQIIYSQDSRNAWARGAKNWLKSKQQFKNAATVLPEFAFLSEALKAADAHTHEAQELGSLFAALPEDFFQSLTAILQKPQNSLKSSLNALLEEDLLLKRLELLEWLIRSKQVFQPSSPDDPVANLTVPPSTPNVAADSAKALLKNCEAPRGGLRRDCFSQEGLSMMPQWASPLLNLQANSRFLQLARENPFAALADRHIASTFWQPTFTLVSSYGLPLVPSLEVLSNVYELSTVHQSIAWNSLLQISKTKLLVELERKASPTQRLLETLEAQKAASLKNTSQFSKEALAFLARPTFSQKLLEVLLGDSSEDNQQARASLVELAQVRKPMSFWLSANQHTRLKIDPFEALELLIWEIDFAGLSSVTLSKGVINSWLNVRTVSEARSWLSSRKTALRSLLLLASIGRKNGEGLRGRLQNALLILRYYESLNSAELRALITASKLLGVFGDDPDSTKLSADGTRALLMVQKLGILPSVSLALQSVAYGDHSMKSQFVKGFSISRSLSKALSQQIASALKATSLDSLRRWSLIQLGTHSKLSSSAFGTLLTSLYYHPPLTQSILNDTQGTTQVVRSMTKLLQNLPVMSAADLQRSLSNVSIVLKEMPVSLNTSTLQLAALALDERALLPMWENISSLEDGQIKELILWLETGLAERLFRWNQLIEASEN